MNIRAVILFPLLLLPLLDAAAASARIHKLLPHYLDHNGHHALSPSLYDRDAYQALLRKNPELRSGLSLDINWKGPRSTNLMLRVELRGIRGNTTTGKTLEKALKAPAFFSRWTSLTFTGEEYKAFGEITSWRATLWEGDKLLAEQRSFLW